MKFTMTLGLLLMGWIGVQAQPKGYVKQGTLPKLVQAIEVGVTSVNATASYKGTFESIRDGLGRKTWYQEGPSTTKGGLGVTVGTFYRLALIGGRTTIGLDGSVMYNMMNWTIGKGFFVDPEWTISGKTKQIAVPVGLELKFGGDGRLEKNHHFCASFGGGIMPAWSTTVLPNDTNKDLKFRKTAALPYIKAEVGVFTRILWKVRLTYAFGSMPLVEEANPIGNNADWTQNKETVRWITNYQNKASSQLMISFIIMPFSWDWPDNGWWNSSNTTVQWLPIN